MWDEGYVSELDYVFAYFDEMSLPRLKLALLSRGVGHRVGTSPTCLELGFGQGLTLAINAATSSGTWYGTDFNPRQAINAMRFVEASGKTAHIFDQSFEQLAARTDLPEFDVISLHGIWSWVSDAGREAILRIIDERLKPGGIVYVSYNAMPGWAQLAPLRHLLREHSQRAGGGGLPGRIDGAIDFMARAGDLGVGYFSSHPAVRNWMEAMRGQDRHYLAHEYMNACWRAESIADVSAQLARVKLGFGASAKLSFNIAEKYAPPEIAALLDTVEDPMLRELTQDYLVDRKFRADIFVKGPRRLSANEVWDEMSALSFARTGLVETAEPVLATPFGTLNLRPEMLAPVIACIDAADGQMADFGEICGAVGESGLSNAQLIDALLVLVANNYLAVTTQSDTIAEDYFASLRFNREMCREARYSAHARHLAAPGIGRGIMANRLQLLVLHAMANGYADEDIPAYVQETLNGLGEDILLQGQLVTDESVRLQWLGDMVREVRAVLLPRLERIGAVATTQGNPFAVDAADVAAADPLLTQLRDAGEPAQLTA